MRKRKKKIYRRLASKKTGIIGHAQIRGPNQGAGLDLDLEAGPDLVHKADHGQDPVQIDQDQKADHDQVHDHLNNLLKGLDQGLDHDQIVLEVGVQVDQDLVQGNYLLMQGSIF